MTDTLAVLDDVEFDELLRLVRFYHREAKKCASAKAYLPGCVMLGSALETNLILMVHCYSDEVAETSCAPRMKNGQLKPLLKWRLLDLLRVAKDLEWLPAGLRLGDEWNRRQAKIGDYAEVVRRMRNLAHPARLLKDLPKQRVTRKHLETAFEVMDIACAHCEQVVHDSLRKQGI